MRKGIQIQIWVAVVFYGRKPFLFWSLVVCLITIGAHGADESYTAILTNKTGVVIYIPKDRQPEEASPRKNLYAGDFLQTSNDSTAVISMLLDKTVVRLRELSTMEILPPQKKSGIWLNLLNGALYFFSRGDSSEPSVRTPYGDAGFVGTEGVVIVRSNQTLLAVLDGTATLTNRWGRTDLKSLEVGVATDGSPPVKVQLAATNIVQWWLFYPAVLDVNELNFSEKEQSSLAASVQAYCQGDLPAALSYYPAYPVSGAPETDSGRIYLAALYLAEGEVGKAENLLDKTPSNLSAARSLRWLIMAVQRNVDEPPEVHTSASEWLGLSYYFQARHELDNALGAANRSIALATNFAFGWERVAELEFGFGRIEKARTALDRSLELAPRNAQAHALSGFLLSAQNRFTQARREFDEAIRLNSNLGNAWLGRGLVRFRTGDLSGGRADLKMAAVLEPNRSLLRSYLGKAFADAGQNENATLEFKRAIGLDQNDPTPWLYSALQKRDENRINDAVNDLENSIKLNDNRAVYRSQLLLDEDRAVRSANLATIYQDAGMNDVSLNEAGTAITRDYANYSAHLFLANSYNGLRDPNLINLRYETATFSEYLIANLLSPVGGSRLSPYVSQQEYSRLFEQNQPGFSSESTYLSGGDFVQQASVYGSEKNTGYAVDGYYHTQNGIRPNNVLRQRAVSVELKQQLAPQDSIYAQAIFSDYDSGDVRQLYDQNLADKGLHVKESQIPNLFLGYHHEWTPGIHTLFLAGRLEDKFTLTDRNVQIPGVVLDADGMVVDSLEHLAEMNGFLPGAADAFDSLDFKSDFEAYSAELQQIAQVSRHMFIAGARYQRGNTETEAAEERARGGGILPIVPGGAVVFNANQKNSTDLTRLSVYGYDQWQAFDPLWLTVGLSFDQLYYPDNIDLPPVSGGERRTSQISPKAGFVWMPAPDMTLRGAFTRSLGGLFFDGSVRLEPVQISGFNQAYRSLIPESVEGSIPGSKFQTFDLALEKKFKSNSYLTLQVELLQSDAHRDVGVLVYNPFSFPADYTGATKIGQHLKYEEKSLAASFNQLVGSDWAFGANYKLSDADLQTHFPGLPAASFPATHQSALLHTLDLHAIFNHPSGLFAEAQALWRAQNNYHDDADLSSDDFWQFNLFAGYRLPQRHAELTLGLLNLTDQSYHLNPLNLYQELPHDRTLLVSFKVNF